MNRKSTLFTTAIASMLLVACGDFGQDGDEWGDGGHGIELPGDAGEDDADGADGDGGAADGGADGGADDGGIEIDPVCSQQRFDLAAEPPSVMLVLDKSSSMSDERWPQGGEMVTRWSSLHGVVSDLVTTYDASIDFGATLFPAVDSGHHDEGFDAACGVASAADVATGPETSGAILEAMPAADTEVQGATPASAGIVTALKHLAFADQGPRAMLLVTDGLANCASEDEMFRYDEDLPRLVAAAREGLDIPTYVVGIDIRDQLVDYAQANAHEVLDEVARAGGVPRSGDVGYYAADDAQALYDAMDEIAARIECTVTLDAPVSDDASVTVHVDGTTVGEVADCSTESGWHFTDDDRSSIELCGQACDSLRVQGQVDVETCEGVAIHPVP